MRAMMVRIVPARRGAALRMLLPLLVLPGGAGLAPGCGAKTELELPAESSDAGSPDATDDRGGRDEAGSRDDADGGEEAGATDDGGVPDDGPAIVELSLPIVRSEDDALQDPGGTMLVRYSWISLYSTEHRAGVRFELADVPPGAAVLDAWLEVYIDSAREGGPADSLRRDERTNPPVFTGTPDDVGSRPLSATEVVWLDSGLDEGWTRSPSLTSLVQPALDDPGYLPGDALVLVFVPRPEADDGRAFEFRQFDHAGEYGARLILRYLEP
jgi:hypothetical protein